MDVGIWKMDDGRWMLEYGRWKMDDGRWMMEEVRWKICGRIKRLGFDSQMVNDFYYKKRAIVKFFFQQWGFD